MIRLHFPSCLTSFQYLKENISYACNRFEISNNNGRFKNECINSAHENRVTEVHDYDNSYDGKGGACVSSMSIFLIQAPIEPLQGKLLSRPVVDINTINLQESLMSKK